MSNTIRLVVLALIACFLSIPLAVAGKGCSVPEKPEVYFGFYSIETLEKFREPIPLESNAVKERIDSKLEISKNLFSILDLTIENPVYRYRCVDLRIKEGEVPYEKWSDFFGYSTDRKYTTVLEVYGSELNEDPEISFEIVGKNTLLQRYTAYFLFWARQ